MPGGLERKLLNYFLLIAVAALMIGVEFAVEMGRPDLRLELWENVTGADAGVARTDSVVFAPLMKFRNKIVIMFLVLTAVVAIVLLMFVRNISTPLQGMVDVACKINAGDLSQVVPVDSSDEIGQLGTAINGLTSNLQEIVAFSRHTSDSVLARLEALSAGLEEARAAGGSLPAAKLAQRLEDVAADARSLQDFVGSLELLENRRQEPS